MNVILHYLYRDYANYKNHGEAILSNPDGLSIEEIDAALRERLIDDEWFYASQWGLKDLHFKDFDDEIDHSFHEYGSVEYTEEMATEQESISEFIGKIDLRMMSRTVY